MLPQARCAATPRSNRTDYVEETEAGFDSNAGASAALQRSERCNLCTRMRSVMPAAMALLLLLPAHAANTQEPTKRIWLGGSWSNLADVSAQTGAIGRSDLTAVSDSSLYVYDYQDHVLKAFTLDGKPKWKFGKDGMRAGEFHVVTSLEVDSRGQVWASDPIVGRVTIVSASGQLVRTIEGLEYPWRIVPRADGTFWGWIQARQADGTLRGEVRQYDSTGAHFSRVSISVALDTINSLTGTASLASVGANGLAMTYFWSDRFVLIDGKTRAARTYRGVERREFPSVGSRSTGMTVGGKAVTRMLIDSAAKLGALSGAVDGDRLYVLFGTGPRSASGVRRTVDTYRIPNGQYLGSYLLPEDALLLRVHNGMFVASVDKPIPAVKIWTWIPRPSGLAKAGHPTGKSN